MLFGQFRPSNSGDLQVLLSPQLSATTVCPTAFLQARLLDPLSCSCHGAWPDFLKLGLMSHKAFCNEAFGYKASCLNKPFLSTPSRTIHGFTFNTQAEQLAICAGVARTPLMNLVPSTSSPGLFAWCLRALRNNVFPEMHIG